MIDKEKIIGLDNLEDYHDKLMNKLQPDTIVHFNPTGGEELDIVEPLTTNDIIDDLTSSSSVKILSAKQGKVLDEKKVDKEGGKSLVSDAEIQRLAEVDNYDDTELRGLVAAVSDDLANYYLKTETYSQAEVDELVSAIPKFAIEVVAALPTKDISTTTVYLLKTSETEEQNLYTEYIYLSTGWEKLGEQKVSLTYGKITTYEYDWDSGSFLIDMNPNKIDLADAIDEVNRSVYKIVKKDGTIDKIHTDVCDVKDSLNYYEENGFLSRNIFKYSENLEKSGYTLTNNPTNVTVNKNRITFTSSSSSYSGIAIPPIIINEFLSKYNGQNITISADVTMSKQGGFLFGIQNIGGTNAQTLEANVKKRVSMVGTVNTSLTNDFFISYAQTDSANCVIENIQIEIGTELHNYTPYAPPNTEISEIKDSLNHLTSGVFDLKVFDYKDNFYLNSDGTESASSNWCVSDFISLPNYIATLNFVNISGSAPAICFYDSSKTLISGTRYLDKLTFNIDIPLNAFYCRLSISKDNKSSINSTITAKNVREINASLSDYNLDNKFSSVVQGGWTGTDYSTLSPSASTVCTPSSIACKAGDTIKIKTDKATFIRIVYRNASGAYVSTKAVSTPTLEDIVPTNATQFVLNISDGTSTTPQSVGHVGVYVNNAIDEIKADLDNFIKEKDINYGGGGILQALGLSGKSFVATVSEIKNPNNYIILSGYYSGNTSPSLKTIANNNLTTGATNASGTVVINGLTDTSSNVRWKAYPMI